MFEHSSRVKGFAAGFGFLRETEFYLLENSKKVINLYDSCSLHV